jgi:hypothetical protein
MRRCATQIWVGVLLAALLAIGTAGSAAEVTPTPEPQVGDIPVCKIEKNGRETTRLVPPHKVQKKLDKDLEPGECPNPANGRVMCKIKHGRKIKNVLVKNKKVQERLDKGWTLGVCGSL